MSVYNLENFFQPKSIAVVGASEREGSIGAHLMRNLIDGGFEGVLFPVNLRKNTIMGLEAFPSIEILSKRQKVSLDLVVIAIPITGVSAVIRQCAEAGAKTVVVISAGGKEIGPAGEILEGEILAEAQKGNIRLIGPNCLGIIVPGSKINASFSTDLPKKGNLAFVSQSGAICTAILDLSHKEGMGFSHFISIGSMIDVDFGDLIDFLGRQPSVKSILLYIEQLTNIRKFMSAARAVSRIKPIIVLKAGSSIAGAQAAASHTGALAGEDAIYDAAFRRAGVIRVETIEELFDCAELVGKVSRPRGPRVGILTNGGGPGVMAVDAVDKCGLELAVLSDETIAGLDEILPHCWSRRNPVDILGDATPERYMGAVNLLMRDKTVDGLLVILTPQAITDSLDVARMLVDFVGGKTLPLFAVWMGGRDVQTGIDYLNDAGIATYSTPERAVTAFKYMVQHYWNLQLLKEIPRRFNKRLEIQYCDTRKMLECLDKEHVHFLPDTEVRTLLQSYGIDFPKTYAVETAEQAVVAAEKIGGAVVLKIISPDISHKTDAGGVALNLSGRKAILSAYDSMMEHIEKRYPGACILGVSVQPYFENPEYELLLGVKRDDLFGPVILFGMGGIFSEVLGDRALALPPLNRLLIQRLINQTKVSKLLHGYRNLTPVDSEKLELMILSLSQLVTDIPEIAELDINPVIVKNGQPVAVDARIIVKQAKVRSPLHLVISPYPSQYEKHVVTKSGRKIFIRPILPEDGDLFVELFRTLSVTSVYFRFFSHRKELTPDMLSILTQVDYDRHLALVAFDDGETQQRMLGVARIIADPEITHSEFSILVGDPWQGEGIGAALLLTLLKAAKQQGCKTIWGTVLHENRQMIQLGKRYGFSISYQAEEGTCELKIDLATARIEVE